MQLSYKYLGTKERKWEKLQYENLAGKLHLYIYIYYEFIHLETAHGYNGTREHGYNVFRVSAKLCKHNLFRNLKSRGHKFHMSHILEVL